MSRQQIRSLAEYREGGIGFKKWVEDFICVDVYPEGSVIPIWTPIADLPEDYKYLWEKQAEECLEALRMVDGRFYYTLLIFCWMRGEGKSLLVCLIQLWKFFCWPKQTIVLAANSKDQTKFVHFDIMKNIILNSPKLLSIVGKKNIQEKEIRLRDGKGNVVSFVRPISSFSGIVSNITGYTFSEMFDMKNPKFFTQLDGSIRNIPNALGTIDSTVSDKGHILYKLWKQYTKGEINNLYYSHRESDRAKAVDFWNPKMDQRQLDNYAAKFPQEEFDRYFRNTWDAGDQRNITDELIMAGKYFGTKDSVWNPVEVMNRCRKYIKTERGRDKLLQSGVSILKVQNTITSMTEKMNMWKSSLVPVDDFYQISLLTDGADVDDVEKLGNALDTDWSILVGVDRNDPMAIEPRARTIVTVIAKGLPRSRSVYVLPEGTIPNYIYVLLRVYAAQKESGNWIKRILEDVYLEFDGIDRICSERWAMFDIAEWCQEHLIDIELASNTYNLQKAMFSMLFYAWENGCLKYPYVDIPGIKLASLLEEEASHFVHDGVNRFYGSKEKNDPRGVQDDFMYSLALGMYGGRDYGMDKFRPRKSKPYFGTMVLPEKKFLTNSRLIG